MPNDEPDKYKSQQTLINRGLTACQIWIKPETRRTLKATAARQGISMSDLAQQILETFFAQENPSGEREYQLNGPR